MKQWIQIWYSWGDQESPVEVPDGVDAWEYMKKLIAQEVFAAQEDYPHGCEVYVYAEEEKVEIKYYYDDEWCYYLITDEEDYNPFDDEEEDE